jgi:methyl acetate hydrolase
MTRYLSRRGVLKATAKLAVAGSVGADCAAIARAELQTGHNAKTFAHLDAALRAAVNSGKVPGVVALCATENGIIYEGVFGERRLREGPAMTRNTVFRVASMVKLITTVAAMQLVEQGKLSLDAPVPDIEPVLGSPQVLDGFDTAGKPQLRPARRPILLRHLLTHTSGFAYPLWDAKAFQYSQAITKLPAAQRQQAPRTPLMFDPGERWQYGTSINWVGRIVEATSGEPLDDYLRLHVLDPLGMKDTGFLISAEQRAREASGHRRKADGSLAAQPKEPPSAEQPKVRHAFSGGGGIYSTAPDYLTLIRALMHGGTLDGVRILRSNTVALMGQNQIGDIEAGVLKTMAPGVSNDVNFFPGIGLRWGFGHMINMQDVPEGRSAGSLTWAGLYNTYYWIDPRKRVAGVFMTQVLPFADDRALRAYRQFERAVYSAVNAG